MIEHVYIGRGSYWGNPYIPQHKITKFGFVESLGERVKVVIVPTAEEAVASYKKFLWNKMKDNSELQGRIVNTFLTSSYKCPGCGLNSEKCHGKVLKDAAIWITSQK